MNWKYRSAEKEKESWQTGTPWGGRMERIARVRIPEDKTNAGTNLSVRWPP